MRKIILQSVDTFNRKWKAESNIINEREDREVLLSTRDHYQICFAGSIAIDQMETRLNACQEIWPILFSRFSLFNLRSKNRTLRGDDGGLPRVHLRLQSNHNRNGSVQVKLSGRARGNSANSTNHDLPIASFKINFNSPRALNALRDQYTQLDNQWHPPVSYIN